MLTYRGLFVLNEILDDCNQDFYPALDKYAGQIAIRLWFEKYNNCDIELICIKK